MDIHNYQKRLEHAVKKLLNSEIPESSKTAIMDFKTSLVVKGLSTARVEHYLFHIRRLLQFIPKQFEDLTDRDVSRILEGIESQPRWSPRYRHDLKIALRVFLRWLNEKKICSVDTSGIKSRFGSKRILPEEILTEQEVLALAGAADNLRDRAFVLVLYESGCRIGELLGLKIKHVQANEHGFALAVNGKTGSRRVLILSSAPALANWINLHPFRNDPESYVWLGLSNRNKNELLEYPGVLMLLKELSKRAGIKKRVNPHSFRHARATHLANHLTEAQMKQHFGWVQGSEMASIYVHLSGRDVDNALLKINGINTVEEKKEEVLKALHCPRCQEKNSAVSKFCSRCGSALNIQTALGLEDLRSSGDAVVNELVKDAEIQQIILKKILEDEQFRAKLRAVL